MAAVKVLYVAAIAGKAYEIEMQQIAGKFFQIFSIPNLSIPEYQGETRDILVEKCRYAGNHLLSLPNAAEYKDTHDLLVEHSNLSIRALGGMPGPYIRPFIETGPLKLFQMLSGFDDKSAEATWAFGLTYFWRFEPLPPGCRSVALRALRLVECKTTGTIVEPRADNNDLGWESIFQPDGSSKTLAEMTDEEKKSFSPRSLSLVQLNKKFDDHAQMVDHWLYFEQKNGYFWQTGEKKFGSFW